MIPSDSATCQAVASPAAIRTGMTSGATGGRNDDTVVRVESGLLAPMKATRNDPTIKRFSGVAVFCSSSWRETIAPATANRLE
jgi:hypothetical protein